jgi:hypothetical protein
VQNAPTAEKLPGVLPISTLKSVPVSAGNASVIVSKKKRPESGKVVVIVKLRCEPSDEVHPVPAEGEFVLLWTVRPVHGSHFPFGGMVKRLPIRTYVEELIVRQKSFAAQSPGSMNANTDAPRIVITDFDKRNDTSSPLFKKALALLDNTYS